MNYTIKRRQTTYWDLAGSDGLVERVHFIGKEEFRFVESSCEAFSIVDEHPLLLDYAHAWQELYVASASESPLRLVTALERAIDQALSSWRPSADYVNPIGPERILRGGYGKLLAAPMPVANACSTVLRDAGVRFSSLAGRPARWPRRVLLAGPSFVVAHAFRVERLV